MLNKMIVLFVSLFFTTTIVGQDYESGIAYVKVENDRGSKRIVYKMHQTFSKPISGEKMKRILKNGIKGNLKTNEDILGSIYYDLHLKSEKKYTSGTASARIRVTGGIEREIKVKYDIEAEKSMISMLNYLYDKLLMKMDRGDVFIEPIKFMRIN